MADSKLNLVRDDCVRDRHKNNLPLKNHKLEEGNGESEPRYVKRSMSNAS